MEAAGGAPASGGLLTDLQRMVLSAAVEGRGLNAQEEQPKGGSAANVSSTGSASNAKPRSSSAKPRLTAAPPSASSPGGAGPLPSSASAKQDRKSHTGINGRPKKGGSGGKGTWGNPLDPKNYEPEDELDPGDPLYDDNEDGLSDPALRQLQQKGEAGRTLADYKLKVGSIIQEYLANGEVGEADVALRELGSEEYQHHFVKRLVTSALDRHDKQKEMAAQLLSALYGSAIAPVQISKGFSSLLDAADDLSLDCPNFSEVLSIFLARAIVDDILPPSFLSHATQTLPSSSSGLQAVHQAQTRLKGRHQAEILEKVWVGDAGVRMTAEAARGKVRELLKEYLVSQDVAEALRSVRDLDMPFFHHEVVKAALVLAMEQPKSPSPSPCASEEALLHLLEQGAKQGLLSASQLDKGFARVLSTIDDLALDIPTAPSSMSRYVAHALAQGWLTRAFERQVAPLSAPGFGKDATATQKDHVLTTFKTKCSEIVSEYFSSGDASEVSRSLKELEYPDLLHHFVKRLISLAMDRRNREREMASLLLSSLYATVIPSDQIESGFLLLLESVEDLALDIPNAADMLVLFLARAVVDDTLSPHFISDLLSANAGTRQPNGLVEEASEEPSKQGDEAPPQQEAGGADADEGTGSQVLSSSNGSGAGEGEGKTGEAAGPGCAVPALGLAQEVVRTAQALLSARHAAERVLRCWGGSGGVVVTGLNTPGSSASVALVETGAETEAAPGNGDVSSAVPKSPKGSASEDVAPVPGAGAGPDGAVNGGMNISSSAAPDEQYAAGPAADAKAKIVLLLEEFAAGGDLQEACRCLRDLHMPFFHHEVVKKAVVMSLERRSEQPLAVLREAVAEWLITPSQVEMGLHRVLEALPDLTLDIPDAAKRMDLVVLKGQNEGWIPTSFKYE